MHPDPGRFGGFPVGIPCTCEVVETGFEGGSELEAGEFHQSDSIFIRQDGGRLPIVLRFGLVHERVELVLEQLIPETFLAGSLNHIHILDLD